jgi:hypothetical protein
MATQYWHWAAGGAALFVALVAGIADHRRLNRRTLDEIGWVPWRGIQVVALFALLGVLILAVKGV